MAKAYSSPVFAPHITLSGISDISAGDASEILPKISGRHSLFPLDCLAVECREKPYQKIIIKVRLSDPLSELHETIDQAFGGSFSKKKDPHLSLLYSNLPCNVMSDSIQQIKQKMPDKIHMKDISVVSLAGSPEEWKVQSTVSLQV